jgi:hypothetical protein
MERFRRVEMIEVVNERNLYTKHGQHLNSEGKENMAKKIASTIECLFKKKVESIRGKWYTKEETGILDHQPVQGKSDNPEQGNKECSSTSGVVDTLKAQDVEQMCDPIIISEIGHLDSLTAVSKSKTTSNQDTIGSLTAISKSETASKQYTIEANSALITTPSHDTSATRISTRSKIPPNSMLKDFLW